MQNQLPLFECVALETRPQVVWEQLAMPKRDKAVLLLATLLLRNLVQDPRDQLIGESEEPSHD